jgi:hypothetical protein
MERHARADRLKAGRDVAIDGRLHFEESRPRSTPASDRGDRCADYPVMARPGLEPGDTTIFSRDV